MTDTDRSHPEGRSANQPGPRSARWVARRNAVLGAATVAYLCSFFALLVSSDSATQFVIHVAVASVLLLPALLPAMSATWREATTDSPPTAPEA